MATVPDKGKEIDKTPSDEGDFDLRHLGGQELSEEDREELKEYAISCGYQPIIFAPARSRIHPKILLSTPPKSKDLGTLSKSIGFPKLEVDVSGYRQQHIFGSLFYSNFKVISLSRFLLPS